jgi:energy-coupling factor transporter ATP-binding protein EcfA2
MKKIQEDNERRDREQEEKMLKYMEDQRKKEEEMRQKLEEAKNEEERKRLEEEERKAKEKREKEEKILEQFKKDKEVKINEEIEKIKNKFIQDKENFCIEQIKTYDENKIKSLVESFETSEDLKSVLEEKIKQLTDMYLNTRGSQTISHLNIVLVGPSGVGKSTLINSVLELDKAHSAKEGEAEPCTMGKPQYFESLKVNFLRLGDSQGIEKGSYGIESVVKDVKNFIESKLLTKDPDQFVHCIWYCITGARFEDIEKKSLEELAKIYNNNTLPIIVVYTKAMMPHLYKPIEAKVEELKRGLAFVPVISKDIEIEDEDEDENEEDEGEGPKQKKKKVIKKKGIKQLKKLSCEKAQNAVQSSCYTGIKNNIKEDVIENNKNKNIKIEQEIKRENKKKISKFKEGMELDEMVEAISEIIQKIINQYIYDSESNLKYDSIVIIENFLIDYFKKNLKDYQIIFEEFIENESGIIAKKIYEFQKDVNIKNNGNLMIQENEEDYKKLIKKKLVDELKLKAELFCLKNAASFISEPIRKSFSEFILSLFDKTLESDVIKKLFEESAKKLFGNLNSKVVENKNKKN